MNWMEMDREAFGSTRHAFTKVVVMCIIIVPAAVPFRFFLLLHITHQCLLRSS